MTNEDKKSLFFVNFKRYYKKKKNCIGLVLKLGVIMEDNVSFNAHAITRKRIKSFEFIQIYRIQCGQFFFSGKNDHTVCGKGVKS